MTERKVRLSGESVSFDCELLELTSDHAILRYLLEEGRAVDMVYLPARTVTLALYYPDRSYNLYFWASPLKSAGGETGSKGAGGRAAAHGPASRAAGSAPGPREIAWYFNIAEPLEMTREQIAYRDLVVDVLVLPDGTAKVLDEDELPIGLDAGLADRIAETKVDLLENRLSIIEEARELLAPHLE